MRALKQSVQLPILFPLDALLTLHASSPNIQAVVQYASLIVAEKYFHSYYSAVKVMY